MLKISFIVCVLFSTAFSFSQKKIEASKTTIHKTDTLVFYKASMEPVNGIVYDLFEDGKTKYQYTYLKGKKNGVFKSWYANEQLEKETNYVNGKQNGYDKRWYENGQLEYKGLWKNDLPIEAYKWYEDGQAEMISPPEDKFGNKKTTFYFPNGLLQKEDQFKNSTQERFIKSWYDNGQLEKDLILIDDTVNSSISQIQRYLTWTNEGFLYLDISRSKDKKNVIRKEWQLDGKYIEKLWIMDQLENQKVYQDKVLIAEFNFSNGNMNGTQTIWDNKGKNLIIQENYKDGNYNGSQKKWFENGQLEREENYIDGKKTGWQRYYDISGKLLGESNLIDGTGKISVKYANGQRAFEESYLNGEPDGLQKSWYKNGQITAEYNFVSGKRVGLQTAYSEKGEIVEEGNLIDGNGIIKENINIDNDTMFWEYNQGILYGPITALYDGNIKYDKGNISAVNFSYDGFHYNVNINGSILNIDRKTEPDNEYSDDPTLQKTSIFIYDRFQLIDFSWDELLYYSRTVSKYLKNCFIIKHECYNSFDQLIHCRY